MMTTVRPNDLVKKFTLWVVLSTFVFNYVWEMLQMPFFSQMSFNRGVDWLFCFIATIGDVGIVLFILALGRLIFRDWLWPAQLSWSKTFYLALAGMAIAVATEIGAMAINWWQYSALMPTLPVLDAGVVPTMQMLILPLVSYKIAILKISRRRNRHEKT